MSRFSTSFRLTVGAKTALTAKVDLANLRPTGDGP